MRPEMPALHGLRKHAAMSLPHKHITHLVDNDCNQERLWSATSSHSSGARAAEVMPLLGLVLALWHETLCTLGAGFGIGKEDQVLGVQNLSSITRNLKPCDDCSRRHSVVYAIQCLTESQRGVLGKPGLTSLSMSFVLVDEFS